MHNPLSSLLAMSTRRRIETMRPRLYRMAYAWCHDPHLADDLAQECLAKALARSNQLREAAALDAWLFAILNNCWRDYLRARREFSDVDDLEEVVFDEGPGPDGIYASQQTAVRVRKAIASLTLPQRQVVTLVDIEECSYADVARILDVPVGTVMSRLSRARQALKARLMADDVTCRRAALRRVK